ncbi:PREDICTED: uncharacterized protein LOC104599862 [Nelumbo nucifera]|uniref:Uncharacterized protein LOC104599862 n=2 Tax=Nelumbo nucifera TaxID=4432 RepID=A0A1U8A3I1_NELNU|nr:PREDICTED: uncharacterized protein LOC104599862 [Nelumbo nucifera]
MPKPPRKGCVANDDAFEHECGYGMEGADGEFDEDQNCGDGLGGDDDWLEGGVGDSDTEQLSGFGVPSTGHDGVGVSSVRDTFDLSDYESLSDNDNPKRRGYKVSWRKTHRACLKAIDRIRGSLAESYSLLPKYCTTLLASNPGSIVKLHAPLAIVDDTYGTFNRVFICLIAYKNGFLEGCRKIVGLDGCHTKTSAIGGIILLAIGQDGNNGIYPIVYFVVEAENKESWLWFLNELRDALCIDDPHKWTFMSDRQKAEGNSYTQTDFAHYMEVVKNYSKEAYDWLCKIPPITWSRHGLDPIVKSDDITNNWTKSFNSLIGESRSLPIVEMLEDVRKRLMQKLFERHEATNAQASVLMPRVESIVSRRRREARSARVFRSRHYEYQIRGNDLVDNVTKMDAKTCTCRVWDISGIPCCHALAVLTYTRGTIEELCDMAFHKSTY